MEPREESSVVDKSKVSQYLKSTYLDLLESGWAGFTKKWPCFNDFSEAALEKRVLKERLGYDHIGQVIVECTTIDLAYSG